MTRGLGASYRREREPLKRYRNGEKHAYLPIFGEVSTKYSAQIEQMMKDSLSSAIVSLLILAAAACSSPDSEVGPMRFSQYSGPQREWPKLESSIAETSFKLPVYRTWPDKPYKVIGSLRHEDRRRYWEEGEIEDAVEAARRMGADAIVLRIGSELAVRGIVGVDQAPSAYGQPDATALAINWKSAEEVRAETQRRDEFLKRFRDRYPQLANNETTVDLALLYLRSFGFEPQSEQTTQKLKDIMEQIRVPNGKELTGKWLYKCVVRMQSLTAADHMDFLGMASVSVRDDAMTVLSTTGRNEVSVSGTIDRGRITGRIGIATLVNADCEGAAVADKISLSGSGRTGDGIVQVTLTLQR